MHSSYAIHALSMPQVWSIYGVDPEEERRMKGLNHDFGGFKDYRDYLLLAEGAENADSVCWG